MQLNRYGYFTEDKREFVITDPRTPRPWFNYMWNEKYMGMISHTAGGFSFYECPRDNRLTRMRYNCLPWDRPGRYVIVKDRQSRRYWSLSWAPTMDAGYDHYECRHGQGYTQIITESQGIEGSITYFVPRDVSGEIWRVQLKNRTSLDRELEIYAFTELLMGNALNDIINQPNDKHFTEIKFDHARQCLIATRRYWVLNKKVSVAQPNIPWGYNLFFTMTLPISGFDGSLDNFIGRWRSEANPESIETGQMKNTEISAGDPLAALQSKIVLKAGETLDFSIVMAVVPRDQTDPFEFLKWDQLRQTLVADKKLAQVKKYWTDYLSCFHIETPDEKFNTMMNVWNQYQAAVTFDMARNAGYYHGGLLFGTGIRDQFQDILGRLIVDASGVRLRILNALQYQFSDGSTLHNFFRLTGSGEKTNHSDTPLWIPFGIMEYLKETGDDTILDEIVTYHDEGEGIVYEHLTRAIDYTIANLTERGLPRIWKGDWNDTLDYVGPQGKGETVWGAFFLGYNLKKVMVVLEKRKDHAHLEKYQHLYTQLGEITNTLCWDGDWFIRAFRDNGKPLGVAADQQGKIFINSQTWSVISGLASSEHGTKALEACKRYLARPTGLQICWPSYSRVEEDVGLISRCVPGKKENGAIFNHASSWFVLAAIMNNDIDYAWDIYQRMMPLNSSRDIDRYEVEPYVYAEYLTSPDHPSENQASHSWLTGSGVWMLYIGMTYIAGFRAEIDGLVIDPHIPAYWPSFKATRRYRGKWIELTVLNPMGKNHGVHSMQINGQSIQGNLINVTHFAESTLNVEVELG